MSALTYETSSSTDQQLPYQRKVKVTFRIGVISLPFDQELEVALVKYFQM
jgi:hypothetical protein